MGALRHRHRRPVGWLVAIAILLHGWLPVLLQAALATAHAEPYAQHAHHTRHADHTHHAGAPAQPGPDPAPAGRMPECPVLNGAICLCAVLVKVPPPPVMAVPVAAATASRPRGRFPAQRPRQRVRAAPFEARAPPFSDRA